jgi:hypothetical protein
MDLQGISTPRYGFLFRLAGGVCGPCWYATSSLSRVRRNVRANAFDLIFSILRFRRIGIMAAYWTQQRSKSAGEIGLSTYYDH